ncbi:MAG: hypothetical protein JRN42_04495 [Nitrososphaerota archaeon]|nr:hypothetical protein [Nitrososphaerota archaeon]
MALRVYRSNVDNLATPQGNKMSGDVFYVDEAELDDYVPGSNATALGWVNAPGDAPMASLSGLAGESGAPSASDIATAMHGQTQPVSSAGIGKLQPAATPAEKLAVSSSAVGFAHWPASGLVTCVFIVVSADVCYRPAGSATADDMVIASGQGLVLDNVDPTALIPSFIRAGLGDGEVRATFYVRSA